MWSWDMNNNDQYRTPLNVQLMLALREVMTIHNTQYIIHNTQYTLRVAAWECSRTQYAVPTLRCHRESLAEESCWTGFMFHCRDSTAHFVDKFETSSSPDTWCFDCHRHEVNTCDDVVVFQCFVDFSCCSGRASLVVVCHEVTWCECVWACSVPSQAPTSSPWKQSHAVGPFAGVCGPLVAKVAELTSARQSRSLFDYAWNDDRNHDDMRDHGGHRQWPVLHGRSRQDGQPVLNGSSMTSLYIYISTDQTTSKFYSSWLQTESKNRSTVYREGVERSVMLISVNGRVSFTTLITSRRFTPFMLPSSDRFVLAKYP